MKVLVINNIRYKLPTEEKFLQSVLNHLDLVKAGRKAFIRLYTLGGEEVKLSQSYLSAFPHRIEEQEELYHLFDKNTDKPFLANYSSLDKLKTAMVASIKVTDANESEVKADFLKQMKIDLESVLHNFKLKLVVTKEPVKTDI